MPEQTSEPNIFAKWRGLAPQLHADIASGKAHFYAISENRVGDEKLAAFVDVASVDDLTNQAKEAAISNFQVEQISYCRSRYFGE